MNEGIRISKATFSVTSRGSNMLPLLRTRISEVNFQLLPSSLTFWKAFLRWLGATSPVGRVS